MNRRTCRYHSPSAMMESDTKQCGKTNETGHLASDLTRGDRSDVGVAHIAGDEPGHFAPDLARDGMVLPIIFFFVYINDN